MKIPNQDVSPSHTNHIGEAHVLELHRSFWTYFKWFPPCLTVIMNTGSRTLWTHMIFRAVWNIVTHFRSLTQAFLSKYTLAFYILYGYEDINIKLMYFTGPLLSQKGNMKLDNTCLFERQQEQLSDVSVGQERPEKHTKKARISRRG